MLKGVYQTPAQNAMLKFSLRNNPVVRCTSKGGTFANQKFFHDAPKIRRLENSHSSQCLIQRSHRHMLRVGQMVGELEHPALRRAAGYR
jgi:hypothetical protein